MERNRIRELRKARGLSLEEIGARIGMTAGNLSKLERGSIGYTQAVLESLAREFGVRVVDLIATEDDLPRAKIDAALLETVLRSIFQRLGSDLAHANPGALAGLAVYVYDEAQAVAADRRTEVAEQTAATVAGYEARRGKL